MSMPLDSDGREPELVLHLHDDAFTDEWFKRLPAWYGRQVNARLLPSDFSADCIQDLLLQFLERTNAKSETRAIAVKVARIAKADVKRALLKEYAQQYGAAISIDDAELRLERSRGNDWLRSHFNTKREREKDARLSDADLDAAAARRKHLVTTAMKILKGHLTTTEWGLLRLRHLTLVPGTNRCYTIKEIAPILGKKYGYLRKLHPMTLQKVRHLHLLAPIIAQRPLQ